MNKPIRDDIPYYGLYKGKYSNNNDSIEIEVTTLKRIFGKDTLYFGGVIFSKIFPCQFQMLMVEKMECKLFILKEVVKVLAV